MKSVKFEKGYYPEIGLTIIEVPKKNVELRKEKYHVVCDCGRDEWILHPAIREKIRRKSNKCKSCVKTNRKSKNNNNAKPNVRIEMIQNKAMLFVESHWKPTIDFNS